MEENKQAYFLDLTVENVCCFGSPAQKTPILMMRVAL
jgi:hypothetical protein